ncbi:MAG: AI-2E family transporter [Phormidesmis sp.]
MKFGKLMGAIAIVVLALLLWKIRQVLLLVFAAVVFATVINRLVRRIQKLPIPVPRGVAVAIALLGILGTLVAAVWFIAPAIIDQIPASTFFSEQGLNRIQRWYRQITGMVPGNSLEGTKLADLLPQLSANLASRAVALFTGSLDFFINLLLVVVLIAMMLANPQSYRRLVILGFPKFYRRRADEVLTQCETALSGWSIGILFNMTVITVFSGVGLWFIGVPLPLVNAIIAGLLTFIPNIGPVISVIPPVLMGLAIAPWMAVAVIILYLVIQQLEGLVLTPLVMEQQVSLLPAVTLIAQVIAALFFGILGLFLALPLVVVIQIWAKELLVKDILDRWPAPPRPAKPVPIRRNGHR